MRLYRRLLQFLRPHSSRMVGNVLSNVIGAILDAVAFSLLIPFLNTLFGNPNPIPQGKGFLTDLLNALVGRMIIPGERMRSLEGVILVIIALVTLKNVFLWLGGQFGATLQERITRDLRDAVFTHMQRLPLNWFSRNKTGQVMARILTDTEQAKAIIAEVATKSVQNLAQILVTIIALLRMSPHLALVSLVIAPLITAVLQPILRKLRKGHRRLRNDYGEITSVLQEVISGIRLVKSFRGERLLRGRRRLRELLERREEAHHENHEGDERRAVERAGENFARAEPEHHHGNERPEHFRERA
jgi:subfamily B ATP-binding cassette protein MsbA